MVNRIEGFDLTRTFSIIVVFIAHIVLAQVNNFYSNAILTAISPGVTMSLLAFISAMLLANSKKMEKSYPLFFLNRITRLFIPVFICLTFAVVLVKVLGSSVQIDHLIYNYLGVGLFFDWFKVQNNSSVGWGLWFVTAILIMYVFLPLFIIVFKHKNALFHFILFYIFCVSINIITLPPETSFWNVAISFALGVYISVNHKTDNLINMRWSIILTILIITIIISLLSSSFIIDVDLRKFLYPAYPIAFIPFFFKISAMLPKFINKCITKFSEISFEFYILQFYFINGGFSRIFGEGYSLLSQIIIGFIICLFFAIIFEKLASIIRKALESYLVETAQQPR